MSCGQVGQGGAWSCSSSTERRAAGSREPGEEHWTRHQRLQLCLEKGEALQILRARQELQPLVTERCREPGKDRCFTHQQLTAFRLPITEVAMATLVSQIEGQKEESLGVKSIGAEGTFPGSQFLPCDFRQLT